MVLSGIIPAVDTHTHTILSGHAWGTVTENARAAREKGMYGICLTEHMETVPGGAAYIVPKSQRLLPKYIEGIRIFCGVEANIIDFNGNLDITQEDCSVLDFVIASLHLLTCEKGTKEQNTEAYLGALQNPYVDILGHVHEAAVPCDMDTVVQAAVKNGKLLEVNASYLIPERENCRPLLLEYIGLCKQYGARICVSSDAHFYTQIGAVNGIMRLLDELKFPQKLIVNLFAQRFEDYVSGKSKGSMLAL